MFNCCNHGWSHLLNPCPLCHPRQTFTTNGTDIEIHGLTTATVRQHEQTPKQPQVDKPESKKEER